MGDSLLTRSNTMPLMRLRHMRPVSIPFSWGTHFSPYNPPPARATLTRLRVSIPFSWGTHFSHTLVIRASGTPKHRRLNPLLMGDSLLTQRRLRSFRYSPQVSIPFSWGTHFSPITTTFIGVGSLSGVSIPFSWGTHFSLSSIFVAALVATVSQSPSHGGLTSHWIQPSSAGRPRAVSIPFSWGTHFSPGAKITDRLIEHYVRLNPLLMGDSLLTRPSQD